MLIKSLSDLLTKKRIYIGIAFLLLIIILAYFGQWYAKGKADEFANSIHQHWMATDGRALYDNIAINKLRIEELDSKFQSQIDDVNRRRSAVGKVINDTIKKGDTIAIAGMFDNLIDRYTPPTSWDK